MPLWFLSSANIGASGERMQRDFLMQLTQLWRGSLKHIPEDAFSVLSEGLPSTQCCCFSSLSLSLPILINAFTPREWVIQHWDIPQHKAVLSWQAWGNLRNSSITPNGSSSESWLTEIQEGFQLCSPVIAERRCLLLFWEHAKTRMCENLSEDTGTGSSWGIGTYKVASSSIYICPDGQQGRILQLLTSLSTENHEMDVQDWTQLQSLRTDYKIVQFFLKKGIPRKRLKY